MQIMTSHRGLFNGPDCMCKDFTREVSILVHISYKAYSLACPAAMQIYLNERKCFHEKVVELPQDWFGTCAVTNMATFSLFWNTAMVAMMSCLCFILNIQP